MDRPVSVSVIIPVHERPREIEACVAAVRQAAPDGDVEIVVVDDGSRDETADVIETLPVEQVRLPERSGAAAARNAGAARAGGAVLFFVDSDVLLHRDALARMRERFHAHPEVAAWFGSYDASPSAPGLVSQYRNLLHHYTHQHAAPEASSFWAGCGAVRRDAFEDVGGFDEAERVEDIELGMRLCAAGYRIRVDPAIQGTHTKRWTLASMIATDVHQRAIPWARLLLRAEGLPDDLNVSRTQRHAVAATGVALASLLGAPWSAAAGWTALTALAVVLALNADWLRFLARARGPGFALAAVPLQLLHHAYSGAAFAWAWAEWKLGFAPARG